MKIKRQIINENVKVKIIGGRILHENYISAKNKKTLYNPLRICYTIHMKKTVYTIESRIRLKIALCADFHSKVGRSSDDSIDALRDISPDVIMFAGDILNNTDECSLTECFNESGYRLLKEAACIAPVFYSPGNHEYGMSEKNRSLLADDGIKYTDGGIVETEDFALAGLKGVCGAGRFRKSLPPADYSPLEELEKSVKYKILLCHHPEYWAKYVVGRGIDLTLSGHAHGGQWRMFGRGVFAPGQGIFPKYTAGVYSDEHENLVVSAGMSNTVNVPRFFNPCEIVVIDLVN